jgi:Tetracyclin repressor-like, C-terminal domain
VLTRDIRRGDLPSDSDPDLLIEAFLTPIYLRVLFSHAPVTGAFLDHLIDLLLYGALHRANSER